ncbi:MAG: hypothetical protein R3E95_10130 [Thiolinea sp.]
MLTPKKLAGVLGGLFLGFVITAGQVALAAAEEYRVNLIATIDDAPAMENVEWTMYRHSGEEVKKAHKHTTHVNLPSGKYRVVAKLTSENRTIVRARNVFVNNDTQVVVPMD